MKRAPEPFLDLRELSAQRIFGKKSVRHLRRIAVLQNVDPSTFEGVVETSFRTAYSYPRFTMVGGRWGLYRSQVEAYQRLKGAA